MHYESHHVYEKHLSNNVAAHTSSIALQRLELPQWWGKKKTLSPGYQYTVQTDVCTKAAGEYITYTFSVQWRLSDGTDEQTHGRQKDYSSHYYLAWQRTVTRT